MGKLIPLSPTSQLPHSLPFLLPTSHGDDQHSIIETSPTFLPTSEYPIELLFFKEQQKCLPERGSKMTRSLLRSLATTARKKKNMKTPSQKMQVGTMMMRVRRRKRRKMLRRKTALKKHSP